MHFYELLSRLHNTTLEIWRNKKNSILLYNKQIYFLFMLLGLPFIPFIYFH
jgi:hypothetical protein